MKYANANGRAVLVLGDEIADVALASDGQFGPDPMDAFGHWPAFISFASTVVNGTGPLVEKDLANPVPRPAQVFAVGLNYGGHAAESGMAIPDVPAVHQIPGQPHRSVRRR